MSADATCSPCSTVSKLGLTQIFFRAHHRTLELIQCSVSRAASRGHLSTWHFRIPVFNLIQRGTWSTVVLKLRGTVTDARRPNPALSNGEQWRVRARDIFEKCIESYVNHAPQVLVAG
ncbi:pyk10-binding protein 1 [Moniliophthora roreri]|nr:pyk10-binding protein 1 [Moniliophthora roreri]